jgi:pullulanase
LGRNATQQLTITASYTKGALKNVTATSTYRSGRATIATVTTGGLVRGVGAGLTIIIVSYTEGGVNKTVTVLVTVK